MENTRRSELPPLLRTATGISQNPWPENPPQIRGFTASAVRSIRHICQGLLVSYSSVKRGLARLRWSLYQKGVW